MLRLIARLLKALNSETDPRQLALAASLALIFGFTPLWTLHNLLVLLAVLVLRVNLSVFIVAWGVFSALAFALDALFHQLGHAVLTAGWLQGLWAGLYDTALGQLWAFNNTVVMGSLVVSVVLAVPLYYAARWAVVRYRETLREHIERSRIMTMLKANRLYQIYNRLAG